MSWSSCRCDSWEKPARWARKRRSADGAPVSIRHGSQQWKQHATRDCKGTSWRVFHARLTRSIRLENRGRPSSALASAAALAPMAIHDAVAAVVATGKLHASASSQDDVWAAQLEAAVASGDAAATHRLLTEQPRGSDPADPDLLLFACEHGHAAVVECLVRDAGLTPSCFEAASAVWAASPLHLAAKNGHNAVVRALLEAGAVPGAADKLGLTALHRASERDHTDVVRTLLDAKASAGAARDNGTTPMYLAARDGHAAIVTLLLDHGADADASMMPVRNAEAGITPLYAAAGRGHSVTVSLLLAAGAQVDRTNTLGTTALFVACSNGFADVALVLLEASAQPDLPGGRSGSRPLLAATERGHRQPVERVLVAVPQPHPPLPLPTSCGE